MFAKFIFTAVLALLLSASPVLAHMTLAWPIPFGDPTTSPLNSDGSNYPCQIVGTAASFYTDTASTSANNTMALGATQTLSFHGSAVHGGGSCQLALTTDMQPSASTSWQVILSIEGGCPTTDGTGPSTYDYTIPDSIAPGKYVFAWTWISKLSGAPEYYMNCAPVTITGSASKAKRETVESGVIEVRDGNSTSSSSSSALPNLFVANLASINSCKTTTSTDPVYPDPGPNLLKPSKMTTNFQSPSGTDCFPLGASNSSSSSSSGSSSGSGSSSVGSGAASSVAPVAASSAAAPGTTLTTLTKSSSSAAAAVTTAPAVGNGTATATGTGTGGIFVTASTGAASSAAAATTPATPATTSAAASSATSAAPQASSSSGSTSSPGGLSGACTSEGMFNCVGGTEYQQCASGTWTTLQAMPAGTKCQDGQSTTLWARGFRRVRRL